MFAPTLRYHQGRFYVASAYVPSLQPPLYTMIFNTTDPFAPDAWGNPVFYDGVGIDPSLFWDHNGTTYFQASSIGGDIGVGILQNTIDVPTGAVGPTPYLAWTGTGQASPEGPHLYFKDGYYYLMIAEGGTQLNHQETIARSRSIAGPYESYNGNPILTNANTTQYFQTVGHADLFQDAAGNWWGVAVATRCGPEYFNYPMGRETVLFPVTWEKNGWPVLQPVRGTMSGPLPPKNLDVPGLGSFINAPDAFDFAPGSSLPLHFTYWRYPKNVYTVSPRERPYSLLLKPSRANLTMSDSSSPLDGQTFVSRRQVDSLFTYSVDMDFSPVALEEETGVTAFLTQEQHLDLGIVLLHSNSSSGETTRHLRFRAHVSDGVGPTTHIVPVPKTWGNAKIRLQIQARNSTHFTFSARAVARRHEAAITLAVVSASHVSSGFTGLLLSAYATTNGGADNGTAAYVGRWRYNGQGQKLE